MSGADGVPVIAAIAGILYYVLFFYQLVIWGRFVADLVLSLNPRLRPARGWVVILEIVFTLTDPPVRFFRRLVPALRLGSVSLDFGLLLTLLSCSLLMNMVAALR